ncbi:MAG: ATP-binding cassette domain-containing protein [Rhizobiales bacterium]|nr:ATP-binding cassette domain-containing protein [Hyphomicrobiales bacterium]
MLAITTLHKAFQVSGTSIAALRGLDLEIARGEFFVLLGPSGCGKTTMLRCIAGLERPGSGTIVIDDTVVFSTRPQLWVPPERRPIGMVFQSYAVWPHMDVYENIAFPLREGVRNLERGRIAERVRSVLDLLGLNDLANRPVTTLSGGQQQRVALARALALQPKVLLMDEPLSNLDLRLQIYLRRQIKELMHRLGLTTVYVTHNQSEALEIGDRIAVMENGRIVQIGRPIELYRNPEHETVARFIGEMNLIEGRVAFTEGDYAVAETALGVLRAHAPRSTSLPPGERCFVGVRPEDIEVGTGHAPPGPNECSGTVTTVRFIGDGLAYTCQVGSLELKLKAHRRTELAPGAEVRLAFSPEFCVLIKPRDEEPRGEDEAEQLSRQPRMAAE